jgi:predicted HD phosphohydrolase
MSAVEDTVQEILGACRSMAGLTYDGEPVDQLEHALQCASLARCAGAARELVVAALLHDIARAPVVAGIPYDGPREDHGQAAARWLAPRVGTRIAWLAEAHVPAKRYLVATDPGYRAQLSEVSTRTLHDEGGPMTEDEIALFCATPGWREAIELRLFDDRGKVPGRAVPELETYRTELTVVVAAAAARGR